MLEQAESLIAKAERYVVMDDATFAQQRLRTLLSDMAEALREAKKALARQRS